MWVGIGCVFVVLVRVSLGLPNLDVQETSLHWTSTSSHKSNYNFAAHWKRIQWKNFLKLYSSAEAVNVSSAQCSNEDASRIAAEFIKLKRDSSECFAEDFLGSLAADDPFGDKVLINIGVNKGYNIGAWTAIFFPRSNISGASWQGMVCKEEDKIDVYTAADCCGICGDCRQTYEQINLRAKSRRGKLWHAGTDHHAKLTQHTTSFIAWDLNKHNLGRIEEAIRSPTFQNHLSPALSLSAPPRGTTINGHSNHTLHIRQNFRFFTVHAAGSNVLGEASIPDCGFGNEWCSLDPNNKQPPPSWIGSPAQISKSTERSVEQLKHNVVVPVATVDHVMCVFSRKYYNNASTNATTFALETPCSPVIIDILQIDTEGNDALVLQGSRQWLMQNLVRVVMFEYHSLQPWPNYRLFDIVTEMDGYGYDCYFLGKQYFWRLSRNCWHAVYEFHEWANAICVRRDDIWWQSIQSWVRQ